METYIPITYLNDFCFCPRSIYFHNIYQENYAESTVHESWQVEGQAAHQAIDDKTYSTRKSVLQGLCVYSEKYGLMGKIDLLDTHTHELTERKNSVTAVYPGFRYQIYAQMFALQEMGYRVEMMKIYSKKSNKSYPVAKPTAQDICEFEKVIDGLRNYSLMEPFIQNPNKCIHCIYNPYCDIYEC